MSNAVAKCFENDYIFKRLHINCLESSIFQAIFTNQTVTRDQPTELGSCSICKLLSSLEKDLLLLIWLRAL